ncbi:MAG: SDR family oxidoreductase [Thioalkalispiraceae bacterium]|jgi:uncharacterized protein YbjT (DUF2867 family)
MHILITGASGFIGSRLAQHFSQRGHQIVAGYHAKSRLNTQPGIETIQLDFSQQLTANDWLPYLKDIDLVINSVGVFNQNDKQELANLHSHAPIALFTACQQAGVKRVIQISALGADATAISPYHISKRIADEALQQMDLDWIIVRPSIVYARDSVSMNFFKALAALPLIPIVGNGQQQVQPIHIDDLIKAFDQLVETDKHHKQIIDMVGPAPVTIRALLADLRGWLGFNKSHFITIPDRLALITAHLVQPLTKAPFTSDAIKMLNAGNTAKADIFSHRFGFKTKSLQQVLHDNPAFESDRWHAGLYFLNPLLRYTLAFLWIYTGVIAAFVYPPEQSYQMLAKVGASPLWQPYLLYSASLLNIILGLAILFSYRLFLTGLIQILAIAMYTILISISLTEQWLHPFGPVSKNIPILVAILIMMTLNRNSRGN